MSKKIAPWIIIVGLIVAVGVVIYKNSELQTENKKLKDEKLKLLKEFLNNQSSLSSEIKQQIIGLADHYENINEDIYVDLVKALKRIEEGDETGGIERLAVIIENILKEKFEQENDSWYTKVKAKGNRTYLANLLNRAKENGVIDNHEYNMGMHIKDIRNGEAHEPNFKHPKNKINIAIIASIEIIFKLNSIVLKDE